LQSERHEHLIAALLAPDVQAAVFEPATAQVGAEFAGDEGGEPVAAALVGRAGQEGLVVSIAPSRWSLTEASRGGLLPASRGP
jgi:hypothetical protein